MREVLTELLHWWSAGQTVGLATVTGTFRSAPRPPGAARDFDFLRLDFAAVGRRAFAALHSLHEGKFTAKTALIEATCRACGTVRSQEM